MKNVEISLKKFSLKKGFITCLALLLGLSVIEVSSLYAAEKQDRTRTAKEVQACKSNQNENSLEIVNLIIQDMIAIFVIISMVKHEEKMAFMGL